jgi:pimeloyl-ACP methyl ester carboxylesterase
MLVISHEIIDGKRLRTAHLGHGPPLLLLHGYPDTLQIWSNLAPLLAARFHVIAFDWPGMGESEAWNGGARLLQICSVSG